MSIITISEDVHLELRKKQTELLGKKRKVRLQDIADSAILKGLPETYK